MVYVTQGTLRNLRNELFAHMEKLPIKYFDTHAHGDIMSIYTNDIDTLRQMMSAGRSGKYFVEQQINLGRVNGYIEEMMKGQKVVKVFCHE